MKKWKDKLIDIIKMIFWNLMCLIETEPLLSILVYHYLYLCIILAVKSLLNFIICVILVVKCLLNLTFLSYNVTLSYHSRTRGGYCTSN